MNLSDHKTLRIKEIFFHVYFLFMFVLAYHFFKERLYADSAYYIFNTIDSGFFVTPHQRIVLALSEVVPLLFFYMGASLKFILVAWSLGHVLFYYIVFLIAFYKFRNEGAALAIILLNVMGQNWLYFSPMLEICYGAALLVLFKILLDENKLTSWRWFWMIILEVLVLTSHPENFIIFFFVVGYDAIKNGFRKSPHIIFLLIFIATVIFKTVTFSEYEGGKIHYMTDTNQNHLYENLLNKSYLIDLWKIFKTNYVDLLVLVSATFIFLIKEKKGIRFLFLFGILAGIIILVNATNFAHEYSRYNESLYYPLVSVAVIAFAFEVYRSTNPLWKIILFVGCLFITVQRISEINAIGKYLSLRVTQMEELIRNANDLKKGKCIVDLDNAEKERWGLNWSYPIESMLLSSMKGPGSTVSLVPDEEYIYRDTVIELTSARTMIRRWEIRDNKNVLPFFRFRDEDYYRLNSNDTLSPPEFFKGKISMNFKDNKSLIQHGSVYVSLLVENHSGKPLSSMPVESCYYQTTCTRAGLATSSSIPIDIDLNSNYIQTITCPVGDGTGEISITTKLFWRGVELASASGKFNPR